MRAWVVDHRGPEGGRPEGGRLRLVERAAPVPGPGEVLLAVRACGVCRTDLHLPRRRPAGQAPSGGSRARDRGRGRRCRPRHDAVRTGRAGRCRLVAIDLRKVPLLPPRRENLCEDAAFHRLGRRRRLCRDWPCAGGVRVPLPEGFDDLHAAPLLCAGIIGYRALVRARVPPGGALGLCGFGASAHLTLQVARHLGARCTSSPASPRRGSWPAARSGQRATVTDPSPEPLDSAILFAPAGELVPVALRALDRGGTLAVAGIHLTDVPSPRLPGAPVRGTRR